MWIWAPPGCGREGTPSGSGSFSTTTDLLDTVAQIRAGIELTASDRLRLRLEYQGQFATGLDSRVASLKRNPSFWRWLGYGSSS